MRPSSNAVTWVAMALAGALAFGGCGKPKPAAPVPGAAAAAAEPTARLKIAVIPKGTTHVFWKSIHAGALKAGQELGAEVIWQGPQKEDDRKLQIEVVESFISRRVDAIVLAPLDDVALVNPVKTAMAKGIKVVIIDSGLATEDYVCFAATDNLLGGKLAAKRLAEVMGGKGKALMLRYAEGSASTAQRERGFLEGIKEAGPGVDLVSTNQYGGVTAESAFQASQDLLTKFGDVTGIFCPNESTTFGMLRALQTAGKAGRIQFVGFDASEPLVNALRQREIAGLTVQDPFRMGETGVRVAVAAIRGQPVDKRIDTGVVMVTPETMNQPEVKALLNPDLDRWLK